MKRSVYNVGLRMIAFLILGSLVAPSQAQGIVDVEQSPSQRVSLGVFRQGWASVSEGTDAYYINIQGEKIRTMGSDNFLLGDFFAIEAYEQQLEEYPNTLPTRVVVFEQDGLRGVINPMGEMLVPAAYQHIDTEYRQFWTLFKHDKKAHYLPDGSTTEFFDDIGYLDGVYFDVKVGNGWHIYHHPSRRVMTSTSYEGFDYCGGCGSPAAYVYAKRNGKWGVIDWEGNILVPFEYDHEHRSMRNDNWVASFSKDGQPIVVHIPTKQEFAGQTELVSGMLIASKDGKYGAYSRDGELVVPFSYDRIKTPNQNYYLGYYGHYLIVENEGLNGVVRSDGEVVVPVEYDQVMVYDDYFVATKDGLTSLLATGNPIPLLQVEHGEITHINDYFYSSGSNGMSIFRVKQKAFYGLYFAESDVFIEPEFYDISLSRKEYFADSIAIVGERQGLKRLFNINGETILPFDIQGFEGFRSGDNQLLAVQEQGKWGLYDIDVQIEITPREYDRYFRALGNVAPHVIHATIEVPGQPDQYVLYDISGKLVLGRPFNRIEPIDGTRYLVQWEDGDQSDYAIFHAETYDLEELEYAFVSTVGSSKLLVVSDNQRIGKLYDVVEEKELTREYNIFLLSDDIDEEAHLRASSSDPWTLLYFTDGLAKVTTSDGYFGLINESEQLVLDPEYGNITLVNGKYLAVAEIDEYTGRTTSYYVDGQGERIFSEEYVVDDPLLYSHYPEMANIAILQKYGDNFLFGLGNLETGEILKEAVYDEIVPISGHSYLLTTQYVEDDEQWYRAQAKFGIVSMDGEVLFEPVFDDIVLNRDWNPNHGESAISPDLFPLLVNQGGRWRYVNADGTYLPIEGTGRL